jgi:ribosomal-protein-alanine N-acetyltransferase
VIIRPLQVTDLSAVAHIEQRSVADPWSEQLLVEEIQAGNGVSFVAEEDDQVCGYAFFRTCAPESELLRLAVDPDRRRNGIGEALLLHALHGFFRQGYTTCFLEVRSSNVGARRLYEKIGFFQAGIRKKYYRQPIEDAVLLCRNRSDVTEEIFEDLKRH